jgi:hypothetical protein
LQRLVGGVTDEYVPKSKGLLPRERRPIWTDEVPANKRVKDSIQGPLGPILGEFGDCAAVKLGPLYRRQLDERALVRGQELEPSAQQRLDRGREGKAGWVARRPLPTQATGLRVVEHHRQQLFGKERITFSRLSNPRL